MFELLFKYPVTVFVKGEFVLLGHWPVWILVVAAPAFAALLAWWLRRNRRGLAGARQAVVWMLQSALAAAILLLLWRPALSVTTLKPQQNIIAVVVDDSRSMAIREEGKTRLERAVAALNGGVLDGLRGQFQVRLYRFGRALERIEKLEQVTGASEATHIGPVLKQVVAEGAGLPIGAVVLASDGADNSGGIDLETIAELRRHRIPVHTAGFGRETAERDVEIIDAVVPARALADARLSAFVTFRQQGYAGRKGRLVISEAGKRLASREVTFGGGSEPQTEAVPFNAGRSEERRVGKEWR